MTLLGTLALHTGDRAAGVAMLEESAELAEKICWRWWRAGTLGELADVAIAEGRRADARTVAGEALDLELQVGDRPGLSWSLSQFALMFAQVGHIEEAGRLWGAIEAGAAFIPGGPWPRDTQRRAEEVLSFSDAAFEQGREEGQGLTLEAAAGSMLDGE
jgi:hypothetical protein